MQNQTIRIITEKPNTWDTIVSHPLQSWAWGEFRKKTGIDVVRIGVFEDATLVDGWQITFHSLPHLPFTIGYFPKGPTPNQHMIKALTDLGKKKNALFIQLEPNIDTTHNPQLTTHNHLLPSHHPLFTKYTFVLDLTKSEEELQKSMHSKTRYNLKVAQKYAVTITEDSSQKAFEEYLTLTQETTKRQGFYAHSQTYHQKMWNTLSQSGIARLFTATYEGQVLAAWIIFAFGDTLYYPYGSSSRDHREVMAPTLLLWEIAKWGKKNGYKKFDLWGAMGPNPNEQDPWFGFHRFKAGFTPQLIEFVGSFDLVINPVFYRLYCMADTLRWFILKKIRS
jgi:lipid II:glycine glycyltransferase (peptidoglycan interpeptide bridge formation enzyme)